MVISLQAMRFGDLPAWANELSTCIRELIQYSNYDLESMDISSCEMDGQDCIFPSKLLNREPLSNQLIANSYQPGEVRHLLVFINYHILPPCLLLLLAFYPYMFKTICLYVVCFGGLFGSSFSFSLGSRDRGQVCL